MNSKLMFSSASDDWSTPIAVYKALEKEFLFTDDPCPLKSELKDGLKRSWTSSVFVNPPYSNIRAFMDKALLELQKETSYVVFLVPARTDVKWWHECVLPHAHEIRFIKGRLRFGNASNNAPFPSCIIVFKRSDNSRYTNREE